MNSINAGDRPYELVFEGQVLKRGRSLTSYGIRSGDTVDMLPLEWNDGHEPVVEPREGNNDRTDDNDDSDDAVSATPRPASSQPVGRPHPAAAAAPAK